MAVYQSDAGFCMPEGVNMTFILIACDMLQNM